MPIWAIVPVKPLRESKSRLSEVLSPEEREALSRELLTRSLRVLSQVPGIARTLVVSRDPAALALARKFRAHTVTESGTPELNSALTRAIGVAAAMGASGVLLLPADLPMVNRDDVQTFLGHNGSGPAVTLSPDRRSDGTNALMMTPPGLMPPAYGPGSFNRHLAQARALAVEAQVCRLPGFELDLDLPDDLRLYREFTRLPDRVTPKPPMSNLTAGTAVDDLSLPSRRSSR